MTPARLAELDALFEARAGTDSAKHNLRVTTVLLDDAAAERPTLAVAAALY